MKEAEEARTLCISIDGLECSKELVSALTAHAGAMTGLFKDISKLTTAGVNTDEAYADLISKATSYSSWYKAREKIAKSMKSAA